MPRDITVEAPRAEASAPDDLRSLAAGLDRLQTDAGPGAARWRRISAPDAGSPAPFSFPTSSAA